MYIGTQDPWPPNRVTASMTDPNGGDVSISALMFTFLIPGLIGLGHSPGPWHWPEQTEKCRSRSAPASDLISLIPGVPGTASDGEFSAGCAIYRWSTKISAQDISNLFHSQTKNSGFRTSTKDIVGKRESFEILCDIEDDGNVMMMFGERDRVGRLGR